MKVDTPVQGVYDWLFGRGWGRVALLHTRTWSEEAPVGWEALAYVGDTPPYLIASVRGPVEGIMEEVVALEVKHPEWCAEVKPETMKELDRILKRVKEKG